MFQYSQTKICSKGKMFQYPHIVYYLRTKWMIPNEVLFMMYCFVSSWNQLCLFQQTNVVYSEVAPRWCFSKRLFFSKLIGNFFEIIFLHVCSHVNLLHACRTAFLNNTYLGLLLYIILVFVRDWLSLCLLQHY